MENSKYFEFQSELNKRVCSRVAVLFETERSTVFHSSTHDRQHKTISTHTNTASSTGRFEVSMYCLVQRIGRTIVCSAGIYRNFPHIFLVLVLIWKMWKLISLFPEDFNALPHYLCWSCRNWFTMQRGATVLECQIERVWNINVIISRLDSTEIVQYFHGFMIHCLMIAQLGFALGFGRIRVIIWSENWITHVCAHRYFHHIVQLKNEMTNLRIFRSI